MSTALEEFELYPKDVRRIAGSLTRCKELKTKGDSRILSFMLIDDMDEPARIQVYCESGTVGTCRVLNGEVREIFQRKCTLRQVREIFHQPMGLPNVDPAIFITEQLEERQPRNETFNNEARADINTLSLQKDEQMVDLGLNILASEFDSLMSHFKAILREKQRNLKRVEESDDPKQRRLQQNKIPESMKQKTKLKPESSSKSLKMVKQTQKKIFSSKEKHQQPTMQIAQQMKMMRLKQLKKKVRQQKVQQL